MVRQSMACGLEQRDPNMRPTAWMHQGYTDEPPTTCVGYTTKLPEVVEIQRLRIHAKNNMAAMFADQVDENAFYALEILESSSGEAMCWRPKEST